MGEVALSNIPPNDHLNRRLLIREVGGEAPLVSLLEHLCTDSVYVLKDEFDQGIDPNRWVNSGFVWDDQNMTGRISGTTNPASDEPDRPHGGLALRSRLFGWRAAKRAVAMIRVRLGGLSGIVEWGFVGEGIMGTPSGVVQNRSTPAAATGVLDFAVGVRDADVDALYGIVSRGLDNTLGAGTNDRAVAITGDYHTLMIALNEQTESRLWVDGMIVSVEYSGPFRNSALGLWLHADRSQLEVDYVQAWQERDVLIA